MGAGTELQAHLKAVISKRQGWAVGLWGAAGLGKTFVVRGLLEKAAFQSLSVPATVSQREIARLLPGAAELPAWLGSALERLAAGQSLEPKALVELVAAALQVAAPFVLHLEDIHEASPERLELIRSLAAVMPRLRGAGLIVTSRVPPPEPLKGYALEPLTLPESDRLLEAQAGHPLPREGLDWVFERAGGNPLFGLEFWRYLTRQGCFWSDGQRWHWRPPPEPFVPASVEAIISQTLAGLSPEGRTLAETRAVLHDLEPGLLHPVWAEVAALPGDEVSRLRAAPELQEIISGDAFVHPLFREVVAQETSPLQRRTYADRALHALRDWPQLAVRFVEDAGLAPCQQRDWLERAAQAAEQTDHGVQAGRWLSRAAEFAQGEDREALALRAARHLVAVDIPEATRLLQIAHQENPANLQTALTLAGNHARMGHNSASEAVLAGLPQDAATRASWARTRLLLLEGQRDQRGVVELWNHHPELCQPLDPDVAFAVSFALMELGEAGAADALAGEALKLPQLELRHRVKLSAVRGLSWRFLDDLDEARRWMDEAVGLSRELGQARVLASSLHNRQIVLQMLGLTAEPAADLQEAADLYQSVGFTLPYASSLSQLGALLGVMGQFEAAEAKLLEAHQILQRFENTAFVCTCEANLSYLYLRWRPPHALQMAQKYARLSLGHARSLGSPRPLGHALNLAGLVALELGQLERALEPLEECLGLEGINPAIRAEAHSYIALALEAQGLKAQALEQLELARTHAVGVQARELDLERMRLRGRLEEARAALRWFEQHNRQEFIRLMEHKWPELRPEPAQPAEESQRGEASIYLRVLGVPSLERGGEAVAYRGRKRLEILCYLLETRVAGKGEATLLELLDAFYPDLPEQQAKLTLRQQIYLLRNSLGAECIQSTPNGYALGAVDSDLELFLKTGDAGLWRGVYLQGLGAGWNANLRDSLELALAQSAEDLLDTDPAEAARLAQIWLEMEPYELQALHLSLRALQQFNPKAAERLYAEAQARMLEVGEALPERLEEFLDSEFVS